MKHKKKTNKNYSQVRLPCAESGLEMYQTCSQSGDRNPIAMYKKEQMGKQLINVQLEIG